MKFREIAPYIIIAVLCIYIFGYEKDPQTIYIPAKENTKVISNPQPLVLRDTIVINGVPQIRIKSNPVNKELLEKYVNLKDSISRLEAYKDAITERVYEGVLKDSVQTIDVRTVVLGTLKEQIISYRTNPVKVERKSSKRKIALFIGARTFLPTDLRNPNFAAGLEIKIQHKKVLYSIGYDTEKRLQLGAAIKLF